MSMFKVAYFIWALLPFGLLLFAVVSLFSRSEKGVDRGYTTDYFEQLLFTAGGLALAVLIDLFAYSQFEDFLDEYGMEPDVIRYLIYPIVLVTMASMNQAYSNAKNKDAEKQRQERKMKYAPKEW